MYLMNVPPVAAAQTKWRTCGPAGGYSLPICFNDSDGELSTRGTPISDKVQMIIDSLRSTQSSLEMGDEIEGNVPPGHEGHPQVCKVAVGSYAGDRSKTKSPAESQQADVSSPINQESSDTDSDDSVDRGIEEAILEYLKEKDDHKRRAEPCFTFLQSSKIPRKSPEVSKQKSDSNMFLIGNNQFPTSVNAAMAPAVIPIKKYIKNKASLSDNTVKKLDSYKSLVLPREQTKSPPKTNSLFSQVKYPVKVEEDSNDSSSDDGIEEAIQRYQLEKKEQQNKSETFNPRAFKEESDSTSDDGIEEAIRCYQLEQLKEKSVLQPFLHEQKSFGTSLIHAAGGTSTGNVKKHRLRKKKSRAEKSVRPPPSSVFIPRSSLSESSKGKGSGLFSFKEAAFKEQPTAAPPKVNTSAELMCAEAILDISKTVMPVAFHHGVGLNSCPATESSSQSSPPNDRPDEESDGSSIDSEDGIEQEIRKFLEQKAQMLNQPPAAKTQESPPVNQVKAKQVATQKKPQRSSLTPRRKHNDENCSSSNTLGTDNDVKEMAPEPSPECGKESGSRSQTHPVAGLRKTEQSGDKSSSLDSDEDLDTAIKDLLKTKKKSKKKTRDLKRKSRMCLEDEGPPLGNALESKKLKPDPVFKRGPLKKVERSREDMKDKAGFSKKSVSQHKLTNKSREHERHEGKTATAVLMPLNTQRALETKEDSSSVDSDDSIELEIRRFLAEKAKVSTVEKSKDGDVSRNGAVMVCTALRDEDIKRENQLAEIPSVSPSSGPPPLLRSRPLPMPQSSLPVFSADGAESSLSSVQSSSPSLWEPADGAGAARAEQWRPSSGRGDVQDEKRARTVTSANVAHSQSESMKWRQSFGLPATDVRPFSRTQFHITTSKSAKTASQTPVTVWSSARTSRAPFLGSPDKNVNPMFRSPVLNHSSAARQPPRMTFTRSVAPGGGSQCPIEGEAESMVHISKDKSVFVELESNRTNHVQVRSRDRSEGKQRAELPSELKREEESVTLDDKRVQRAEEDFIDEAECESGNRRDPEKQQGFSTLSLSSAIDPGMTIIPYIALNTEERSWMFNRRYLPEKCKKGIPSHGSAAVRSKTLQHVKRKLQFIPVNRR